jgi:G3E family GTPase
MKTPSPKMNSLVGIDGGLISNETKPGHHGIELANGCVCCSVRGETAAPWLTADRRDAGTLIFDRLLLETTGLADPACGSGFCR